MVAPSVNFLMISVGIVAYPISKLLDCLLGEHHAIRYTNNDLKALIELHSKQALQEALRNPNELGLGLLPFQTKMIQGAIDIQNKKVKDIMIPFQRVFSLRITKKIDVKLARKIVKLGYSRIPVYIEKDKNTIIGYLLIKTLIGVDLKEGKTLEDLISDSIVTLRKPLYISPNDPIESLLNKFINGRSHMALVTDNISKMEKYMNKYLEDDEGISMNEFREETKVEIPKVLGIVTLEDVIESALKEDILDEADYDLENNANLIYRQGRSEGGSVNNDGYSNSNLAGVVAERVRNKFDRNKTITPQTPV